MLNVLLAGLVVLGSVSAGTGETPGVTHTGKLNCRDPIGSVDRPPGETTATVRGAIALQTGDTGQRAMATTSASNELLPSHTLWRKAPLYVRADRTSEIRVPKDEFGRLAITWGNTASDALVDRSLSVGKCPSSTGWIVFPGGYYATRPGCYALVVRVGNRDTRIRIGLGAACPGQKSPGRV
jgi:hypothetical protein